MPDQTDIDDPAWTVVCQEPGCGKSFRRRSLQGAKPKRCDDCKAEKKRQDIDKLRAKQLQKPHYEPEPEVNTGITQPVDDLPVVAKVEPSWLDDADAQELLVERQRRELGLDEAEASVALDDPETAVARTAKPSEVVGFDQPAYSSVEPPEVGEQAHQDALVDEIKELEEALAKAKAAQTQPTEVETQGKAKICIAGSCSMPDPMHVDRFCTSHWQRISLEDRGVMLGAPEGSAPFDKAVGRALRQFRE